MSMEDDLFRMFRHIDFGSMKPTDIMAKLLQQYELGILRMLKEMVDTRIEELMKGKTAGPAPGIPDEMNPFVILGVDMNATKAEVDAAYKREAAKHHPDRGGSHEQMVKINAAYEVIYKFRGWRK